MNVILICLDYKDRHRMKRCPFLCFVGLYLHWLCFSFDQVQQCVRVMLNQVITRYFITDKKESLIDSKIWCYFKPGTWPAAS
uniref:Uncharacterized protein n=1 Tax=Daphnia magna TaxID=35525 RepID=A0A0P5XHS8_9CRUS